jgi:predicted N-acetyltransferase YhbS
VSQARSDAFQYRVATSADAAGILAVLQEAASEVPVSLDTPERQQVMADIISECSASGESWVAIDDGGVVVGFVLAKPDRIERFLRENKGLTLPYIGVSKVCRRLGIFDGLMKKLTAKGEPLTASVLENNQSTMVDRLAKIGFVKTGTKGKQAKLRWSPKKAGG